MRASIRLNKRQALDVAALAYAAGDADGPSSLQEMLIRIDVSQQVNYVTFGATNSYVAVTRRGTFGEFDGQVEGSGVFSIDARKLARLLRLAVKEYTGGPDLKFLDSDGLEINGVNVGLVYHPRAEYSADRIDRITEPLLEKAGMGQQFEGVMPSFDMQLLSKLAQSSNVVNGARKVMRFYYIERNRWGYVTPFDDSWRFAGVIQEYKV